MQPQEYHGSDSCQGHFSSPGVVVQEHRGGFAAEPFGNVDRVFRNPGGKSGSRGDTGGVEIKAAEVKVDGVAESLAVAEPAR